MKPHMLRRVVFLACQTLTLLNMLKNDLVIVTHDLDYGNIISISKRIRPR